MDELALIATLDIAQESAWKRQLTDEDRAYVLSLLESKQITVYKVYAFLNEIYFEEDVDDAFTRLQLSTH